MQKNRKKKVHHDYVYYDLDNLYKDCCEDCCECCYDNYRDVKYCCYNIITPKGPTGPTGNCGPVGATGPTGETGPMPSFAGAELQITSEFNVNSNEFIPWDSLALYNESTIFFNSESPTEIILTDPGNYYVSWWINCDTKAGQFNTIIEIVLDNIAITSCANPKPAIVLASGLAMLTVANPDSKLQLKNISPFNLASIATNPIKGSIIILYMTPLNS